MYGRVSNFADTSSINEVLAKIIHKFVFLSLIIENKTEIDLVGGSYFVASSLKYISSANYRWDHRTKTELLSLNGINGSVFFGCGGGCAKTQFGDRVYARNTIKMAIGMKEFF